MRKRFSFFVVISALVLSLALAPVDQAFAQFANGTYDVPYEMKEASNNNTSIADGYFQKPAKVTIDGSNATVQFTVTSAEMVKSLSAAGGSMKVTNDAGDTRTYQLTIGADQLKQPITMDMHIIVPEGTPGLPQGYDRKHQARAVFDVSKIPGASGKESSESGTQNENQGGDSQGTQAGNGNDTEQGNEKDAENPKTSDDSPILLYTMLLIGAAGGLVLVRKLRPAQE